MLPKARLGLTNPKHFKGKNPLHIPDSERKKTGEMLLRRFKGLKHIGIDRHYYFQKEEKDRVVCNFFVEDSYLLNNNIFTEGIMDA